MEGSGCSQQSRSAGLTGALRCVLHAALPVASKRSEAVA
jgi:hypothetical protein